MEWNELVQDETGRNDPVYIGQDDTILIMMHRIEILLEINNICNIY